MSSIKETSRSKCRVSLIFDWMMTYCVILMLSPQLTCAIKVKPPISPTFPTGIPKGLPTVSSIIAPILVSGKRAQVNYCELFGTENTMCKFPNPDPKCARVPGAPTITKAIINKILKTHNNLRARVANGQETGQPSASNMKQLVWNDELALMAQTWANQCRFEHDNSRETPAFPVYVGQNIFFNSLSPTAPAFKFPAAIKAWYNEVKDYKPGPNNVLVDTSGTGHYTQVVWGDTSAVGCGFAQYTKGQYICNLYICNYGPGGNLKSLQVYKTGTACTACDPGVSCSKTYPGLCSPPAV